MGDSGGGTDIAENSEGGCQMWRGSSTAMGEVWALELWAIGEDLDRGGVWSSLGLQLIK